MARISTYTADNSLSDSDMVIGTDAEDTNITKNYRLGDIATFVESRFTFAASLVLEGQSTSDQEPSGLDTLLQVEFGPAQGGPLPNSASMDSSGTVTFNETGQFWINVMANFERQGSSGGVTVTGFRALKDGVAITNQTIAMDISSTGIMIPYEHTFPVNAQAGTVLKFEIVRDSSGVDAGGLYTHTMNSAFDNIPSAAISIHKQIF
tara:strand:- start:227 stop:847 length:621 start_codon:yes stop_codon:yes gene_type:complete